MGAVVDDGKERGGALDVVVAIEKGVEVIGWESRFESALVPDGGAAAAAAAAVVDVVTGRKLVDDGNADDVAVAGLENEKDAVVVVGTAVVDDGVANENAEVVAVGKAVAEVVVAGADKEKDGAV